MRALSIYFSLSQRIPYTVHGLQDAPGELSPALGRLRYLQLLDLGASKLSGDLAVLRNATGLRTLNLSHSEVGPALSTAWCFHLLLSWGGMIRNHVHFCYTEGDIGCW